MSIIDPFGRPRLLQARRFDNFARCMAGKWVNLDANAIVWPYFTPSAHPPPDGHYYWRRAPDIAMAFPIGRIYVYIAMCQGFTSAYLLVSCNSMGLFGRARSLIARICAASSTPPSLATPARRIPRDPIIRMANGEGAIRVSARLRPPC